MPNILFYPSLPAPENSLIYEKYIHPFLQSRKSYQTFASKTAWQEQVSEMHTAQLLMQLWEIFIENIELKDNPVLDRKRTIKQYKLQTMIQYIHDHYKDAITLTNIAESASVSKSSSSKTESISLLLSFLFDSASTRQHFSKKNQI